MYRRWLLQGALVLGTMLLAAGCAQAPLIPEKDRAPGAYWSGRLALQVQSEPPQFSSAAFELKVTDLPSGVHAPKRSVFSSSVNLLGPRSSRFMQILLVWAVAS